MIRLPVTKPHMLELQYNSLRTIHVALLYEDLKYFLITVSKKNGGDMHQTYIEDVVYRIKKEAMEPWLASKNKNLFEFLELKDE